MYIVYDLVDKRTSRTITHAAIFRELNSEIVECIYSDDNVKSFGWTQGIRYEPQVEDDEINDDDNNVTYKIIVKKSESLTVEEQLLVIQNGT